MATTDVRARLRALLAGLDADVKEPADDASLITSGLLDSLGLFSLAMWVEDEVGKRIDLAAIDLSEEWDTIIRIVAYIERFAETNGAAPAEADAALRDVSGPTGRDAADRPERDG